MAKCLICGHEAKNLQPHLKSKHHLKVHDYYEQYNTTQLDVYDYNNADRLKEWEKLHPEEAHRSRSEEYCRENPQYVYIVLTEKDLFCIRDGEITTSAQQELKELLKI